MGTIYKHLLTGKKKKGDLGHVWLAAHFPNRIRRTLVEQTSISSSVDKILMDQLPIVTYRILGFLLLGVARIYSKKVEYLLVDCNNSLNEMLLFNSEGRRKVNINVGGMCLPEPSSKRSKSILVAMPVSESSSTKSRNTFVEAMRAQFCSVSLPENFELDAFDLDIAEDESNDNHVKSHSEIVLPDAWESGRSGYLTFGKDDWTASASFADHASTSAPIINFSPSNLETSAENLRHRFSLDECMDPMVLSETEEEVGLAIIPSVEQEPEWMNTQASIDYAIFGDSDHPDWEEHENDKNPDDGCTTGEMMVSEMALGDDIIVKPSPDKHKLSVTIDVTPQSKAVVSGEHRSDFVAVHTPASKEPHRAPRKHKLVYDEMLVLPNTVYKDWVKDASDLVGKRRRAPSALLAWKKRRSFDYFLEPIIPINADFPSDLRSFASTEIALLEGVEDTMEPDPKTDDLGSVDMHKAYEEIEPEPIARFSPVNPSTPLRFSETQETSKVNQVEPTSSYESRENEHFPINDEELDAIEMKEGPSSLGEDNEENGLVAEKWSAVTKNVGSYLHSNIVHRKEKGEEEAVNLCQILKHRSRKESARFFSEILVLKTKGYIDVKQEKAYDEIRVTETLKLKEVFRASLE